MRLFGKTNKDEGKCCKCKKEVLKTSQFEAACREAGFTKDKATDKFKMKLRSGAVFLNGNPAFEQMKYNAIENQRGYQCISCKRVYCLDCLYTSAPPHPGGGKACPKCGSTFQHYE
ncbi:hypothetical protein MUP42_01970 [Candidatus Bathyarchaeota archaeon]|nr:hypothetical protein [Candidatus Bathyarchaeota archaeon]